MAPGDRRSRSRSRSRGPSRPAERNDGWNVWRADARKDDRPSSLRAHDIYSDRRGDTYSRDYNDRFGGSNTYRPRDDLPRDYNDQGLAQRRSSPDFTRRRASVAEIRSSSLHRPQTTRQNSHHSFNTNAFSESPIPSPNSTASSIPTISRTENEKKAALYSIPITKDPRLARAVLHAKSRSSNEDDTHLGPHSAMTLDGAPDSLPQTESQLNAQDIAMTDVEPVVPNKSNPVVDVLLRLIQPAIGSYTQQRLMERLDNDIKKAKEMRDKAAKHGKHPPEILKSLQMGHEQAVQNHAQAYRCLSENKAQQSALAELLVKNLSTLIGETFVQQNERSQTNLAETLGDLHRQTDTKLFPLQQEISNLKSADKTMLLEKKQGELQKLVEQAQPIFEENIDFLKMKHKEQQIEMGKLRAENVSLKADIKSIKSAMEALQQASQQAAIQNDAFKRQLSTDLEAKTQLIGQSKDQVVTLTGQVQGVKQSLETSLSKHLLKAEFDAYKAASKDTESVTQQGVRFDSNQHDSLKRVERSVQDLEAKTSKARASLENTQKEMAEVIRLKFDELSRESKILVDARTTKFKNEQDQKFAGAQTLMTQLEILNDESRKLVAEMREVHDSRLGQDRESSSLNENHSLDQAWKGVKEIKDALRKAESVWQESMEHHRATIKKEVAVTGVQTKDMIEKVERFETDLVSTSASNLETFRHLTDRIATIEKASKTDPAAFQAEFMDSQKATKERVEMLQHKIEDSIKSTEGRNEIIYKRLDELSERPATLSAKDRLMLTTLSTIPKRLNDIESIILESDKIGEQDSGAPQTQPSRERFDNFNERINTLKVDLDLVKTEITGQFNNTNVILNEFSAKLRSKTTEWEAALAQQRKEHQSSIHNTNSSLAKTTHEVRGVEHSLTSLTARYNQLTTERLVRQIAEVVHPLPTQLKTDQAILKEQVSTIHAKMGDLSKAVAELAARSTDDGTDQVKDASIELNNLKENFNRLEAECKKSEEVINAAAEIAGRPRDDVINRLKEIGEELNTLKEDFKKLEAESKKLEAESKKLQVQLGSGRGALQKEQDEHTKRLSRLERRVVHKDDWPSGDEDDEDERVQRQGSNLLREFQSHRGPSKARSPSATAKSKSRIASPSRVSPMMKTSEAAQHVFGRPSPLRSVTNPPEAPRSLASRIEPPQSLTSRIEPATSPTSPVSAGTKRSLPSDSEDLDVEDTVIVQRAPLGAPTSPRTKDSRKKVKKATRTSSLK